jgi:hypothetical protein
LVAARATGIVASSTGTGLYQADMTLGLAHTRRIGLHIADHPRDGTHHLPLPIARLQTLGIEKCPIGLLNLLF